MQIEPKIETKSEQEIRDEAKEKSVVAQATEELKININDLTNELVKQADKFLYWATAHVLAIKKKRMVRLELRELEAELSRNFRDHMASTNPTVRPTEKMINDFLAEHPLYKDKSREFIRTEYLEELLEAIREAFKQRNQLLLELAKESFYGNDEMVINLFKKEMLRRENNKSENEPKRRGRKPKNESIETEIEE